MKNIYNYSGIGGYRPKRKTLMQKYRGYIAGGDGSVADTMEAVHLIDGDIIYEEQTYGRITCASQAGQDIMALYSELKQDEEVMEEYAKLEAEQLPLLFHVAEKLFIVHDEVAIRGLSPEMKKLATAFTEYVCDLTGFSGECSFVIGSDLARREFVTITHTAKLSAMSSIYRYTAVCLSEFGSMTVIAKNEEEDHDFAYLVIASSADGIFAYVPGPEAVKEMAENGNPRFIYKELPANWGKEYGIKKKRTGRKDR